jgi:hypothetical protein
VTQLHGVSWLHSQIVAVCYHCKRINALSMVNAEGFSFKLSGTYSIHCDVNGYSELCDRRENIWTSVIEIG